MYGKILLSLIMLVFLPFLSWGCEEEHTMEYPLLTQAMSIPQIGASVKDIEDKYLNIYLGQSLELFKSHLGDLKTIPKGNLTDYEALALNLKLTTSKNDSQIMAITTSQAGHKIQVLGHEIQMGDPGGTVLQKLGYERGFQRNKTGMLQYSAIIVYTDLGIRFFITQDQKVGAIGIEMVGE